MDTTPQVHPGWYPCPTTPGLTRYFDGRGWTERTVPAVPWPAPHAQSFAAAQPATLGASPTDPMHWILPTGRSGASIAAGYMGLLSLFIWALGPVAVGMGIWGLRRARVGGHGSGRSIFAIVVGIAASMIGLVALTGNLF